MQMTCVIKSLETETPAATFVANSNVAAPTVGKHVVAIVVTRARAKYPVATIIESTAADAGQAKLQSAYIARHANAQFTANSFSCLLQQVSHRHFAFTGANLHAPVINIPPKGVDRSFTR